MPAEKTLFPEDVYKLVVEEASILAALYIGPEIRIKMANKLMLDAWGKDSSVIGKTAREANPEWEGQPFFDYLDEVFQTGIEHVSVEEKAVLSLEGGIRELYYTFNYKPLKRADGSVWGIVHTAIDVTAQVEAKKSREESEKSFSNMVLQSPVATCIYSGRAFVMSLANKKMLELIGKTGEQALNKPFVEGFPEIKDEGFDKILEEVYNTGCPYEAKERAILLPRDGKLETFYVDFTYTPIRNASGVVTDILSVAYDVSDKVFLRKQIEENEQRLQLAIQSSDAGIFDIDIPSGTVVRSGTHARIFGYSDNSEEWNIDKFKGHLVEKDKSLYEEVFKRGIETGRFEATLRIKRIDNKIRWVDIVGMFQYRDCVAVRLTGTITDITEKKELQRQKDEFISTVSHEVKTPLTSIKAYAQFLHKSSAEEKHVTNRVFLDRMLMQIKRLEKLVANLFDATRVEAGKLPLNSAPFEMSVMVSDLVHELQMQNPSHELIVGRNDPLEVVADKERIEQVLTNFIVNAVKYSPGASRIYILSSQQDGQLICSVQDFGNGISEAQKPHVFERFHQVSKGDMNIGLGLGLYICREIIKREGGRIWFDSRVGEGSTFYFSLPLISYSRLKS